LTSYGSPAAIVLRSCPSFDLSAAVFFSPLGQQSNVVVAVSLALLVFDPDAWFPNGHNEVFVIDAWRNAALFTGAAKRLPRARLFDSFIGLFLFRSGLFIHHEGLPLLLETLLRKEQKVPCSNEIGRRINVRFPAGDCTYKLIAFNLNLGRANPI
jgi:hypothetical protein